MRKTFAFLLALALLLPAFCFAEDAPEENEGTIFFLDEGEVLPEDASEITEESEPFIPEDVEKHIIGKDDRITVRNPRTYPYSAIAYMVIKMKCGCSITGTGFMVDKRKMLTAAHCLICPTCSQWAKTITFYFGYKSPTNYLYRYTGSWTGYVGTTFRNHRYTIMNDYGVVKFNAAVGSKTGWFGAKWNSSNKTLNNKTDYVAGYHNGILKYGKGKVFVYDAAHLKYSIDTQKGTSGGPVYNSSRYALGINIAESSVTNLAHRLTKAVYRLYLH
jgi:V8-like Glu-specific endopeptidase